MRKNFVLMAAITLMAFAISASAQKATDFSGTWSLDVSKSKLGDRNNIESQTMVVTQTAADIKIETTTKRTPPPADGNGGGAPRGSRGMGGFGGGDGATTYTLDGKESKTEVDGQGGMKIPVTMKSSWDGAKLKLDRSMTFSGPMGEVTAGTKEVWELGSDGKTLTINTERTSPRGTESTTKVFTKN